MDRYCPMISTTDFFMHCCKKLACYAARRGLLLRGVLLAWLFAAAAYAEGISVTRRRRVWREWLPAFCQLRHQSDFHGTAGPDARHPAVFCGEFSLMRSRWYWLDEEIFQGEQTVKLSYNMLTRQYRISRVRCFRILRVSKTR